MKKIFYYLTVFICIAVLSTSCTKQCQCKYYRDRYKYEQEIASVMQQYNSGAISRKKMEAQVEAINKKIDQLLKDTQGHCNVLTSISTADGLQYFGCE